jgi:proteasome accessory factor A
MNEHQSTDALVLPKLCGADIELGNFIAGENRAGGTGYEASRALLAEIDGLPKRQGGYLDNWWAPAAAAPRAGAQSRSGSCAPANGWGYNPQDTARRYVAGNGGCAYIDLDHAELCIPEVLSAFDHVAAWHAMLRIMRSALDCANRDRPRERKFAVLVNNTDGHGNSYGSHLNFLVTRRTWDNIFSRKPHYLQALASFQTSSILLTGSGKVGVDNHHPYTPYQLSQRADFFETLQGIQTTFNRPIVNARDETLCGYGALNDPSGPARLHVIFYDSALAHGSAFFRVGPMQLFLTLMERGLVNSRLILDDPLSAVHGYSRDPSLKAQAALISGERLTALELQSAFLEDVKRYAAQGVFDHVVPRYAEIISLWEETLTKFASNDWTAVARRGIDWVLKLMAIERAMDQSSELDWDSPEIKVIDALYSSLDDDGLYWAYEAAGFAETLVTPERIAHFAANPPTDTRAWTRAMLLQRASSDKVEVDTVDWDRITFKIRGRHSWPSYRTLDMADPLGFTQAEAQPVFDNCDDFGDLLDGLESVSTGNARPLDAIAIN